MDISLYYSLETKHYLYILVPDILTDVYKRQIQKFVSKNKCFSVRNSSLQYAIINSRTRRKTAKLKNERISCLTF